jgi:hypothetical protein
MNGLPTARTTLRARYVSLLVWCKGGCQHQAHADLQKLIDTGRGDVPLTRLRFPLFQLRQRSHGLRGDVAGQPAARDGGPEEEALRLWPVSGAASCPSRK